MIRPTTGHRLAVGLVGAIAALLALSAWRPVAGAPVPTQAEKGREVSEAFARWGEAAQFLDPERMMSFYSRDFLQSGMTPFMHKFVYRTQFDLVKSNKGTLLFDPEVRNIRFWQIGSGEDVIEYADVDLVLLRQEEFDDKRYIDRVRYPMRLRRIEGQWKACGDRSRTLCVLQVGWDGKARTLTAIARSPQPGFPARAFLRGPGVKKLELRKRRKDSLGKTYVTETIYAPRRFQVGDAYVFDIPWYDRMETIRVKARGTVDVIPTIKQPVQDMDITEWPIEISWESVSDRIKDFDCYEVHIRRAEDRKRVFAFRSIPPERTSVTLGDKPRQLRHFTEPHTPYYIEVYAFDIDLNYAVARSRVYYMVGAEEAGDQPPQTDAEAE